MSSQSVNHATFTIQRDYAASPAKVFAAWATPESKARWFGATEHALDFRVGGKEINRGGPEGGPIMTFESTYQDIVPNERIVYASTLSNNTALVTVSVTTVELAPAAGGTRLVLTEYGAFLDGLEKPAWREEGTGSWLDALGAELQAAGAETA
jgi:uncharacterized protein YndB with AHSA1/START domain